jgi:hypothetical protein
VDESRTDQISFETKLAGAGVVLVLLLAFLALYVEPDHTDKNFAWTILPRTSAVLMGAAYTAGAYFFARVLAEKKWHRVQAGFLSITGFTVCMLAATLLHWGRFHQGSITFYLWLVIYALTPFVVPFLWWRNRETASADLEPADFRFSATVRGVLGIGATAGALAFVVVFARPSILIALAPWKLTELTSRVFAGWSILTLLTVLNIAYDGRWSATRILMQSAMVALALTVIALPRIWGDFDPGKPMTYLFMAGTVVTLVAFAGVHLSLDGRTRRKNASPTDSHG